MPAMFLVIFHPSSFILYFTLLLTYLLSPITHHPLTYLLSTGTYNLLIVLAIIAVLGALLAAAVMALSRHKKSGTGEIQLIGAEALVHGGLTPEGAVLIQGELWRARSLDGTSIAAQVRVEVAAVDGHLLLVKRYA